VPQPIFVRTPVDLASVPDGVFLGPGHTWLELEPAGAVRVGVDRLAPTLLGGVETIAAVPAGTEVRRGDRLALLRKGERTVEVRSPVDGVVTAANAELAADPGRLAAEPFGAGWLLRLKPRELAASLRRLFIAEEAREFLRNELANLREFLVGLSLSRERALATATLPDGGLPVEGLAARLPAEDWSALTERFF
jgi:glycine cleavage system H protein